jgi:uncharacterized membrane protein
MACMNEKHYHVLFQIGVAIKAIQSALELVFGFVLVFFDYGTLYQAATFLTGDELIEGQTDPVIGLVMQFARGFAATPREYWAFLFISHAFVKIFLLWGLFREKLWAYPASAVVFGLFVVSQLHQTYFTPSLALWLVTAFDVVLIILILREYRKKKAALARA